MGYAEGLPKRVIVTAYEGTELPFDVKDMPTLFWELPAEIEEKLTAKIKQIT